MRDLTVCIPNKISGKLIFQRPQSVTILILGVDGNYPNREIRD